MQFNLYCFDHLWLAHWDRYNQYFRVALDIHYCTAKLSVFFNSYEWRIMFYPETLQGPREKAQIKASFKYESLLLHCDRESWRRHPGRVSGASDSAQTTFWLRVSAAQMMKGVKTRQSTTSLRLLGQCQLPNAAISRLHNSEHQRAGSLEANFSVIPQTKHVLLTN